MHGVGRRRIPALLALLCGVTAACADPDFRADAEDARRLDLLRSDRLSVYLGAPARCTESLAVFVPSDGHPLSFDAVEDNVIRCPQPASDEGIVGLLAAAEEDAGWSTVVDGGRFELSKQFGDLWATARLLTGLTSFDPLSRDSGWAASTQSRSYTSVDPVGRPPRRRREAVSVGSLVRRLQFRGAQLVEVTLADDSPRRQAVHRRPGHLPRRHGGGSGAGELRDRAPG